MINQTKCLFPYEQLAKYVLTSVNYKIIISSFYDGLALKMV